MQTIILPVENLYRPPTKKEYIQLSNELTSSEYIITFQCRDCKYIYTNLFEAKFCLHPLYYQTKIKSKL
jgi:hypothetical protein